MAMSSVCKGWRFPPLSLPRGPRRLSRDSSAAEVRMVTISVVLTDELKRFVDEKIVERAMPALLNTLATLSASVGGARPKACSAS